jgi:hypothetical protein
MLKQQGLVISEYYCPFDDVFQLTDIAGPAVVGHNAFSRAGDALDFLIEIPIEQADEMLGQRNNVFLALAQRRQEDRLPATGNRGHCGMFFLLSFLQIFVRS